MRGTTRRTLALFLPSAVVVTALAGLVYASVQQDQRSLANDPQLQLAEDAAARLTNGAQPQDVVTGPQVDLSASLAPFITVVGPANEVLASTATLDGKTPVPPVGVLDAARAGGNDTVTWQPASDVRQAIVVIPFDASAGKGTVIVGRSLRAIEQRENLTLLASAGAWLVTLIALLVACRIAVALWGGGEPQPKDSTGETRSVRAA
jgi:hypothetical protein